MRLLWDAAGKVKDLGLLPGYTDSVGLGDQQSGRSGGVGWRDRGNTRAKNHVSLSGVPVEKRQNGRPRLDPAYTRQQSRRDQRLQGQVVGNAYYRTDEAALLWQNGKVYELNRLVPARSGWKLQNALGINKWGQIIGNGIHNGIRRGFLLTPVK